MDKKNQDVARELENIARKVRCLIIEVLAIAKSPHVGSVLSCVDILVVLYFHLLNISKESWKERDIFILSKAHAAVALYAILFKKGLIDEKIFWGYHQDGGLLPAHLDRFSIEPVEVSAGSLGHGFNMALGIAYGYKLKGDKRKIVTLIGDGESEEGSIWEGAEFASRFGLDNVTAVLDYNNLQGYGRPTELCHYEPVDDKWASFGWDAYLADGHDYSQLIDAFNKPHKGKPKIIIARTTKGKGVSFMEDELKWHYFLISEDIKIKALKELS